MDPYKPRYTASDLSNSMPSLDEKLMQNWFVRGVIKLADKSPGRGKKRLYNFHEALQVNLVSIMTWNNETTKLAGPIAKACADFYAKWILEGNDPREPYGGDGEEFVMVFTVLGKASAKGKRRLSYRILKKQDLDINKQSIYFKVLDFHYCAWRLYETLEDVVGMTRKHWILGTNEKGLPTNPDHPWYEIEEDE